MRPHHLVFLLMALSIPLMAQRCNQHPDQVDGTVIGFYPDSTIMIWRSAKYDTTEEGWQSWLPDDSSLLVTCGLSGLLAGVEKAIYHAEYHPGDDSQGYTYEETVATNDDGSYVVSDEVLADNTCLPWIDVTGPPHPSSGVIIRRAQGNPVDGFYTYVNCDMVFPVGHPANTCATDCGPNEYGYPMCWVAFVGE